eukprot:TRINITY_DN16315_c0_g1_i1.p1 TRINITY_DN16315_c0_g1~~TRINITY_DN16315_c0_g1_i1.p1  ORF type:complete len:626 (+),score=78.20 TRINITY_DN16315_c0_g1_i1:60-1880(+)
MAAGGGAVWIGAGLLGAVAALLAGLLALSAEQPVTSLEVGSGGYDLDPVTAPVARGLMLRVLSRILTHDWIGPLVCRVLLNDNNFQSVRQLGVAVSGPSIHWPLQRLSSENHAEHVAASAVDEIPRASRSPRDSASMGVLDYYEHYRAAISTPLQQVQKTLAAAKSVGSQLRCFVEVFEQSALEEASRSTERWSSGQPLGPLDGVPFAVKDELAMSGTVLGEGFTRDGRGLEVADDIVVARLRAAGGVLIGKTVMTTFGASPLGWNSEMQGPLSPWNTSHYTGGSSAGTAVAVAAGIVPVAIGVDGGGSIRLPAAFSGVFGIAPTFGRVPFNGLAGDVMSVIRVGPLATDAASLAIVHSIIAQPEPTHHYSELYGGVGPPPPHLARFNDIASLKGIRLGVFTPHFDDASPATVEACRKTLRTLEGLGATIVEVRIPHLKALSLAHALIIGSEMGMVHDVDWADNRDHIGADVRISFGLFRAFSGKEYVAGLRVRGWAMRWLRHEVFSKVDLYVSPTSGTTAPLLPVEARSDGESNAALVMQVMKYIFLCNLAGNPGISIPVGYEDGTSLPIGLHLMADHWQESVLLRVANSLQAHVERRRPTVFSP